MRQHRFHVGKDLKLKSDFWLHDEKLLWQWNRVLRFRPAQQVRLFDGAKTEKLYKIVELSKTEAHLKLITDMVPVLPARHIYLFWSLLKKENNEHIIQKCTEIGVSNFIPVISERTIKKDFNIERARKIAVEASEQCGRTSLPIVREPLHMETAINEYKDKIELYACLPGGGDAPARIAPKTGLIVGPEGGFSEDEQKMFSDLGLKTLDLGEFTLRAETAAIVAASKLL